MKIILQKFLHLIGSLFRSGRKQAGAFELCKANSEEAYDKFWSDEDFLKTYLEPARVETYTQIIDYAITQIIGTKIVDIGFGSGDFLKLLLSKSKSGQQFEVHGIDFSNAAINRASKLIPNGKFIKGDVYRMPYEANFFDNVFCIQTLEHLINPDLVLKEFDRICKKNGVIFISIPNGELDTYEGHVNFWKEEEFKRFLSPREVLGFKILNDNRVFMVALRPLKG